MQHFSRRRFLIGGVQVAGIACLGPMAIGAELAGTTTEDHVLVVVQLSGGNDGLNTVVPFRQDAYFRSRSLIGLDANRLHKLDGDHGLHPRMGELARVFDEGDLGIWHGVGYPQADRSHFRSMQIWHTADPDTEYGGGSARPDVGWLGRLAGQIGTAASMPALFLGRSDLPLSFGTKDGFTPSVKDKLGFKLRSPFTGFEAGRASLLATGSGAEHAGDLGLLRRAAQSTYSAAERMQQLNRDASSDGAKYPNHRLASELRLCATLIAGNFGPRVFGLELGGFDTHSRQSPVHADLLGQLSASLGAFQSDLKAKGVAKRVTTLVFSEFGRRAAGNASGGTDHGQAGPVFVMGEPARAGMFGTAPDLDNLVDGDVPFTTDFRSIYSSLESEWMGVAPSTAVKPALVLR